MSIKIYNEIGDNDLELLVNNFYALVEKDSIITFPE